MNGTGDWIQNCTCSSNNITSLCNATCSAQLLPPLYYTKNSQLIFHTFYVLIMLVGIFGNFLTIYVIVKRKSMRRAIHLYTFNLAVTDLLILLFYVPTQMSMIEHQSEWRMGLAMCKVNNVILPVSLSSSIGTLLAITIDRFRGLVTPFSWRSDSQKHARISIPLTWFLSFAISAPLFIYPTVATVKYTTHTATYCIEGWPNRQMSDRFWVSNFALVFVLPLIVIVTTQVIMLVTMTRELSKVNRRKNKHMIRMVVALVLVFTLCTGYQHVFYLLTNFSEIRLTNQTAGLLYGSSNMVVALQAAINPIIYGTLRQDFKKGFVNILAAILIRFEYHKKVLKSQPNDHSTSFATRILTTYFSEWNSSSTPCPNKKHQQMSVLFQKKMETESPYNNRQILSSTYDTTSSSSLQFYLEDPSPISNDSPIISAKEVSFYCHTRNTNDEILKGHQKFPKSNTTLILHKDLLQKYADASISTDFGKCDFEKEDVRRSRSDSFIRNALDDHNNNTILCNHEYDLMNDLMKFMQSPTIQTILRDSKETIL